MPRERGEKNRSLLVPAEGSLREGEIFQKETIQLQECSWKGRQGTGQLERSVGGDRSRGTEERQGEI